MIVKYFKATSKRLGGAAYYAAYNLPTATVKACFDINSPLTVKEVALSTIPENKVIHAASLDDEQTKILTARTVAIGLKIIEKLEKSENNAR